MFTISAYVTEPSASFKLQIFQALGYVVFLFNYYLICCFYWIGSLCLSENSFPFSFDVITSRAMFSHISRYFNFHIGIPFTEGANPYRFRSTEKWPFQADIFSRIVQVPLVQRPLLRNLMLGPLGLFFFLKWPDSGNVIINSSFDQKSSHAQWSGKSIFFFSCPRTFSTLERSPIPSAMPGRAPTWATGPTSKWGVHHHCPSWRASWNIHSS